MGAPAQWQRPGARRAADRPRAAGALREQVGIQKKLGVSIELRVATHRLACSHNAGPAELGRRLFQVLGQAARMTSSFRLGICCEARRPALASAPAQFYART